MLFNMIPRDTIYQVPGIFLSNHNRLSCAKHTMMYRFRGHRGLLLRRRARSRGRFSCPWATAIRITLSWVIDRYFTPIAHLVTPSHLTSSFFFFSLDLSSLFLFSLWSFPFVSLFHRMCMSCLSYLLIVPGMIWHCIAHCCAYCIPGTWQRSISVAQLCDLRTFISSRIEESARTLVVLDVDG